MHSRRSQGHGIGTRMLGEWDGLFHTPSIPDLGAQSYSLNMVLRHEVARLIVWHVYRPDLLFHQQYPTRMCGKVTPCTEPSDTVPTVTRLAPEPRGNGVSASIRRRRGWMDGMVNRCELSINVVTRGKPKMLPGLGQKGTGAGTGSCHYPYSQNIRSRRTESTYPIRVNLAERGKPVSLLLCR